MLLTPGAQVCYGCGLVLDTVAVEPIAVEPVAVPEVAIEPDAVPEVPVAQVAEPVTEPIAEPVTEPIAESQPAQGQALVTPALATPAARDRILAFDPLPPLTAPVGEDPYVTAPAPAPVAPAAEVEVEVEPTITVEDVDAPGLVRGHALPADETLAVPAAYATFAPETYDVPDYRPESGTADVIEINFPGALTVAPPQAPVADWPQPQSDPYVTGPAAEAR
ncbi:MAG TPA: hypothetical protein VHB69_13060 [Mycobacteriales bacterium]|nr:hypothetical protein [Mycobacteriales bacterium]